MTDRYEAHRLFDFPIGNDTAHGVWDHQNQAFIRLDNRTWNTWDAGKAEAAAVRLNAGKGLEDE